MATKRKTTDSKKKRRGRPPSVKPAPEELSKTVWVECWEKLAPIVIDGNCDGKPPELVQQSFVAVLKVLQPNKNLRAALQAKREIGGAYRKICAAIDAYARIRDLLFSEVFSEAEDFVRLFDAEPPPEGIGGFTLRHMLKMQPHLDALLGEKELMGIVAKHEPSTPQPDTARSVLLSYFYNKDEGWRDALRIGRLMTWRELAMLSILAGHWPSVDEGHASIAEVIRAEKKALRAQATRMNIPTGPISDERDELWGYVDFCRTHFFIWRAHATPFRNEGSSQHDPSRSTHRRRPEHRARSRRRRRHQPHHPTLRGRPQRSTESPRQARGLLRHPRRSRRSREHQPTGSRVNDRNHPKRTEPRSAPTLEKCAQTGPENRYEP